MKAGANAVVEDEPTSEVTAVITKIDELLEKFIGIRDLDLSTTMHKLAVASTEVCHHHCFAHAMLTIRLA